MTLATMVNDSRGPVMQPLHGFEVIGRAARLIVGTGINNEIEYLQEKRLRADLEFEEAGFDVGVSAADVEHVEPANVFQGPHKSLASSPITRFPNVSMTAYATRPSAQNAVNDRMDVPELSLLVEFMVKAGPVISGEELLQESIVHRRVERTAEALITTIAKSGNLLGTVDYISLPRGGIVNASWTRNEESEGETGSTYLLHGARFVYALTRRVSRNY